METSFFLSFFLLLQMPRHTVSLQSNGGGEAGPSGVEKEGLVFVVVKKREF